MHTMLERCRLALERIVLNIPSGTIRHRKLFPRSPCLCIHSLLGFCVGSNAILVFEDDGKNKVLLEKNREVLRYDGHKLLDYVSHLCCFIFWRWWKTLKKTKLPKYGDSKFLFYTSHVICERLWSSYKFIIWLIYGFVNQNVLLRDTSWMF